MLGSRLHSGILYTEITDFVHVHRNETQTVSKSKIYECAALCGRRENISGPFLLTFTYGAMYMGGGRDSCSPGTPTENLRKTKGGRGIGLSQGRGVSRYVSFGRR